MSSPEHGAFAARPDASEPPSATGPQGGQCSHTSDDKPQLELEELRLRIRDLKRPWWQRPAVTAPLATIIAAIVGVFWAGVTGFFDVARRELLLSRREVELQIADLQRRRESQDAAFQAEKKTFESTIASLERRVAAQRLELAAVDQPVLTEATYRLRGTERFDITMRGTSLGSARGQLDVRFLTRCPSDPMTDLDLGTVPATVSSWSPSSVAGYILERQFPQPTSDQRRYFAEQRCAAFVRVRVRRRDDKLSNPQDVGRGMVWGPPLR